MRSGEGSDASLCAFAQSKHPYESECLLGVELIFIGGEIVLVDNARLGRDASTSQ
jgi:hypothetical protein